LWPAHVTVRQAVRLSFGYIPLRPVCMACIFAGEDRVLRVASTRDSVSRAVRARSGVLDAHTGNTVRQLQ
jgi:hypothetical protein